MVLTLVWAASIAPLRAQVPNGSLGGAAAGSVLGAYSGTLLALTAALIPCGQSYSGPRCSGVAAFAGGGIGFAAGAVLGGFDEDRVRERYRGGAIGAGVGAVAGYALKGIIRQYGWLDVASGAALGLAVGASARGAALGAAAGGLAGGALLVAVPSVRIADAVAVGLAGMAVGGVLGWASDAVGAHDDARSPVVLSFRFGVR